MEAVKVWKITLYKGASPLVVDTKGLENRQLVDDLRCMAKGDECKIICTEMVKADLEALPEWDGP